MLTIKGLYNNVSKLDTDKVIVESFEKTSEDLASVNRERMMDGIKADGSEMPHYSYISQTVYGYPDIRITLRDTGEFQDNISIKVTGDTVNTDSDDPKSDMLKERYGEKIFGLGGDYKRQYLDDHLGPEIRKGISSVIGLKFSK